MSKIAIELNSKQIESAVEKMTIPDKIRLVRKLQRETRRERWGKVITKISQRYSKSPITGEEINHICENTK